MENQLFQSGYLSIPLKINENLTLNPQPNWMIIENVFGKVTTTLPMLGTVICSQSTYKLVYREMLEESIELNRPKEMREVIYEYQNQSIPVDFVPYFSSHQKLNEHIVEVNQLLSLFNFRGILANFQLEIDQDKLIEIINQTNE